jgi:hypothetical protein
MNPTRPAQLAQCLRSTTAAMTCAYNDHVRLFKGIHEYLFLIFKL